MPGDKRVYVAKKVEHGATTIASATHFATATSAVKAVDPGPAGSPGIAEEITTHRDIIVTIFGYDPDELRSLVEAAAANFVGTYIGEAGADKTLTIKDVVFNDPPSMVAPAKDAGGAAGVFSITGRAEWGAADTWALMLVYA